MTVVACIKWLTPHDGDDRFGGISPADSSALEWALRLGEAHSEPVVVVTLGPAAADAALRDALACGARRAIRIDAHDEVPSSDTAAALAQVIDTMLDGQDSRVSYVCCGDYSLDRGTGSVPAFLAAELEAGQALGLVELALDGGTLTALRRLDGGRRERLAVEAPAVVSVEGAVAHLRRASLSAVRAAARLDVEIIAPAITVTSSAAVVLAYRPRARVVDAPTGGDTLTRLRLLTATTEGVARSERLDLDPEAAAARILRAVREWGHLD